MRKFSQREVGTIWRDRQFDKNCRKMSIIVEHGRMLGILPTVTFPQGYGGFFVNMTHSPQLIGLNQ